MNDPILSRPDEIVFIIKHWILHHECFALLRIFSCIFHELIILNRNNNFPFAWPHSRLYRHKIIQSSLLINRLDNDISILISVILIKINRSSIVRVLHWSLVVERSVALEGIHFLPEPHLLFRKMIDRRSRLQAENAVPGLIARTPRVPVVQVGRNVMLAVHIVLSSHFSGLQSRVIDNVPLQVLRLHGLVVKGHLTRLLEVVVPGLLILLLFSVDVLLLDILSRLLDSNCWLRYLVKPAVHFEVGW